VLVLSSTFPRWKDDTEPRFVLDLCQYLSEYVDIQVLAPHTPGAALNEVLENVPVRRFRYFVPRWQAATNRGGIASRLRENPWRMFQLPLMLLAFWLATLRLIREYNPDVIHAHWSVPQGLVACLAARHRVPVLCTSHGGDLHALQSRTLQAVKRWVVSRCRIVTVVSQSMVEQVKALSPEIPVEVIPMGTDLRSLFIPPKNPATRKDNEIAFVGRLVEKKGLRYLIEAFAMLQRRQQDLTLTIAGDGPLMESIRRQVFALGQEKSVARLGGVRQRELPEIYQRGRIGNAHPDGRPRTGDSRGPGRGQGPLRLERRGRESCGRLR
jgi:glycosyltransferase involved in cell wall biosynthesis